MLNESRERQIADMRKTLEEQRYIKIPQTNRVIANMVNALDNECYFEYDNNKARICGVVDENFHHDHNGSFGDTFLKARMEVRGEGGIRNYVNIIVPGYTYNRYNLERISKGEYIKVTGNIFINKDSEYPEDRGLSVFVEQLELYENGYAIEKPETTNVVYLEGIVCKPVVHSWEGIAGIVLAVDKQHVKSEIIHCMTTGKIAEFANEKIQLGQFIRLYGFIHSNIDKPLFIEKNEGLGDNEPYKIAISQIILDSGKEIDEEDIEEEIKHFMLARGR